MTPVLVGTVHIETPFLPAGEYDLYRSAYMSSAEVPALFLTEPGDPYDQAAVLTVNLPGLAPEDGNVFIKTWSENSGILEAAQKAGVVGEVVRWIPTGHASAAEVPLLMKGDDDG